jgi:hypothetical protein
MMLHDRLRVLPDRVLLVVVAWEHQGVTYGLAVANLQDPD